MSTDTAELKDRDAKIAEITRTLYDGYQVESTGYRVAVQH